MDYLRFEVGASSSSALSPISDSARFLLWDEPVEEQQYVMSVCICSIAICQTIVDLRHSILYLLTFNFSILCLLDMLGKHCLDGRIIPRTS